MLRHTRPSPRSRYFPAIFLTTKTEKISLARGGVYPKERELQINGELMFRRGGAGRAERKPGARGSEVRRGRGAETPPRGPRSPRRPRRTRGAALAPTRRLSQRRGLAGARQPARDPPSSPSPPPAQRAAAAARVLPKRLRPPRLGPESLRCTHLVSSATFLTKRDVLGGRR